MQHLKPMELRRIRITDAFWGAMQKKVMETVIPYQWEAINDRIPDAEKSYAIRNFRAAAGQIKAEHGGFIFQDSDLAKWLEAVGWSLMLKPDPELEKLADEAIDLVCAAQQPDGYLDTYFIINGLERRFSCLQDDHELYCFGHMLEAALAYHAATGKDKLLKAMERFADCIDRNIGPEEGKLHGYPGHEEAELALAGLYERTGNEKYLRMAKYFIDERGQEPLFFREDNLKKGRREPWGRLQYRYHQAHKPVREQQAAVGHAVRACYLYTGMADAARLTGDESLIRAVNTLWRNVTERQMYITGSVGSSEYGEAFTFDYDLPNDTVYGETCAAIALVFFARRMLQLKPRGEIADVMERALYNGIISGMSLDGQRFFYVNPLEVLPEASEKDHRRAHVKPERQKWFGCACCPPNIARLMVSLGRYMVMETEDSLWIHLYGGSDIQTRLNGSPVTLRMDAELPRSGLVRITVTEGTAEGRICLRIPGWSRNTILKVNGSPMNVSPVDGYQVLERSWQPGDEIEMQLDMSVRIMAAHPLVRADAGKLAVTRGPLVYCLEEKDNGANLHLLRMNRRAVFAERYEPELLDGITVLTCEGRRLTASADALYAPAEEECAEAATLTFVPYYAWANRGSGEMTVWVHQD